MFKADSNYWKTWNYLKLVSFYSRFSRDFKKKLPMKCMYFWIYVKEKISSLLFDIKYNHYTLRK